MSTDQIKEIYQKYRIVILPVLTGLASLVIIVFVIIPHFLTYLDVRKQISGTMDDTAFLVAKAEELQNIDEAATRKDLQTVFTVLPSVQEVPQAMSVLQGLVQKSGLGLISTVYVSSGAAASGGNNFGLNLTVNGPLSQVKSFLSYLQAAPRMFQVQSVNVRFQRGSSGAEVEVPIRVFFSPESGSIGSIDKPLPQLTGEEEILLSKLTAAVGEAGAPAESTSSAVPLGKSDPFQ